MSGKIIAIDFDGVIRMGTDDILLPFDPLFPGSIEFIRRMQDEGNMVFIHTARNLDEVVNYLDEKTKGLRIGILMVHKDIFFSLKEKFILKRFVELSNTKFPADIYIDDKALRFRGNWEETEKEVEEILK